ncbi:hypothetical protein K3495_g6173 [Podosphaera aphanis]|nr:hypothetical protein K3495_g6173 [Podosphaera aphanis]
MLSVWRDAPDPIFLPHEPSGVVLSLPFHFNPSHFPLFVKNFIKTGGVNLYNQHSHGFTSYQEFQGFSELASFCIALDNDIYARIREKKSKPHSNMPSQNQTFSYPPPQLRASAPHITLSTNIPNPGPCSIPSYDPMELDNSEAGKAAPKAYRWAHNLYGYCGQKSQIYSVSLKDITDYLDKPKRSEKEETDFLHQKNLTQFHDFLSLFSFKEAEKLPPHRYIDHEIPVDEKQKLVLGPLCSMSDAELEALREYLRENLERGFIETSTSSFASPMLFFKKPGGGLCFCVDYRALNAITKKSLPFTPNR